MVEERWWRVLSSGRGMMGSKGEVVVRPHGEGGRESTRGGMSEGRSGVEGWSGGGGREGWKGGMKECSTARS